MCNQKIDNKFKNNWENFTYEIAAISRAMSLLDPEPYQQHKKEELHSLTVIRTTIGEAIWNDRLARGFKSSRGKQTYISCA